MYLLPEGRLAVTTTPTQLVQPTHGRLNVRFLADPANTKNIAIKHSKQVAVTGPNCGLLMTPGTLISLNNDDDKDIDDGWWAVAVSGTQHVIVNIRLKSR